MTFLFVLLASCGQKRMTLKTRTLPTTSNPAFAKYAKDFEKQGKRFRGSNFKLGNIPIVFGDDHDFAEAGMAARQTTKRVGLCVHGTDGRNAIYIRKAWWDHASEYSRRSLVFHELGHCRLDRRHSDDLDQYGEKISLMHPVIVKGSDFADREDEYLRELFIGHNH